jgi:hypothetical protein
MSSPCAVYALTSLSVAVILLTAAWTALFRRACPGFPCGVTAVVAALYTLFPDCHTLTLGLDVLLRFAFNAIAIYGIATLLVTVVGDGYLRGRPAAPAPAALEEGEPERGPWLPTFLACWHRPGPVA